MNSYRPTPAQRKNAQALKEAESLPLGGTGETPGITFAYYTWFKPNPDTLCTLFSVTTDRYIPVKRIERIMRQTIPGCRIGSDPLFFYRASHSFDVRTPTPMRWRVFTKKAYEALKEHL